MENPLKSNNVKPSYFAFSGTLTTMTDFIKLDCDHPSLQLSENFEDYDVGRLEHFGPFIFSVN